MKKLMAILFPLLFGVMVLAVWQAVVTIRHIPPYVLPAPTAIAQALAQNSASLLAALGATLKITLEGFIGAAAAAILLAILFSQSRLVERTLYPYAVTLQVTPVVAVAPLILIWVGFDHIDRALALIVGLIAFFPILSSTVLGLRSADPGLMDLARLYGATRWQTLARIQLPSALPSLLTGLKIGGVIALIGEVTAEFAAGSGTASGLAWRITESGNRLEIATLFAALSLLALAGVTIFAALSLLEYALLRRWHASTRNNI